MSLIPKAWRVSEVVIKPTALIWSLCTISTCDMSHGIPEVITKCCHYVSAKIFFKISDPWLEQN